MKFITFYKFLFTSAFFSFALPATDGVSIEDSTVVKHDVSKWDDPENNNIEFNEFIVNGLAATNVKKDIEVNPKTQVINFQFYKWITEFLKAIQGVRKVRLASILIHYKPHTDKCTGTVAYALVDQRFENDGMKAQKKTPKGEKKSETYNVVGQVKHLVPIKCDEESVIQFSMNHFVTVRDLKKVKLIQIVSGVDMTQGTLATISIGWKTITGDATVYKHYPAQLYTFPRLDMPELSGASSTEVFGRLARLAKNRRNKEAEMLKGLQNMVDAQHIMSNDLELDLKNDITGLEDEIKRHQDEIQKIDKVLPGKKKVDELKRHLSELEKIKKEKLEELKGTPSGEIEKLDIHQYERKEDEAQNWDAVTI
ncbi:movement protein [Palo verde broom virus]|uniref:Movement protein n=1 Tax=Palo verde broom virus TaxID=2175800 RepID=A0A2S1R3A1_9VIRU|nr:movement protein [Palo verde broom virus]AWH90178.1 movement protein [Palo verde broom virus]AWH90179.1 movement protein [Palo verde broom virus]AWH90180.1 movement protein [Palo verde broom virus]AWH90181.1 movement protein [Palo verde broom virus]AWH90182.1 movement protein [Palo verde broom virus]